MYTPINQTQLWYPHRALLVKDLIQIKYTCICSHILMNEIRYLNDHKNDIKVPSPLEKFILYLLMLTTIQFLENKRGKLHSKILAQSVLEGLNKIYTDNISYLVVLDADHKIKGYFSARALRGVLVDNFKDFVLDIESFLNKHSPESLKPIVISKWITISDGIKSFFN